VTQWSVIFWWMKAERSDLEGKNLGLMRRRFVAFIARKSTVSLPCIPLWLEIQIKIMSCAREASKVWLRETMGWGAWLFDSVVRAEREFVAVNVWWVGCLVMMRFFLRKGRSLRARS